MCALSLRPHSLSLVLSLVCVRTTDDSADSRRNAPSHAPPQRTDASVVGLPTSLPALPLAPFNHGATGMDDPSPHEQALQLQLVHVNQQLQMMQQQMQQQRMVPAQCMPQSLSMMSQQAGQWPETRPPLQDATNSQFQLPALGQTGRRPSTASFHSASAESDNALRQITRRRSYSIGDPHTYFGNGG